MIGLNKLQGRYKSFESRRQLLHEHDVFLADDRIITRLPQILGKTFYKGSKKPVPVNLEAYKPKGENGKRNKPEKVGEDGNKRVVVAQPQQVTREIERTLATALVYLSPAATTSVRVGAARFTPEQLAENIEAVVKGLVEKFVTKKWRNVRAVHIKGPNTMALPVWMADELWVDEGDVLGDEEAVKAIAEGNQKGTKRKGREGEDEEGNGEDKREDAETKAIKPKKAKKAKTIGGTDADMSKEMALRREKLRAQKAEAREAAGEGEDVISVKKTKVVKTADQGDGTVKVKTKTKKRSVVAVA